MKVSAAISPCPNDVWIFAGLLLGKTAAPGLEMAFELQELETLNRGALEGRWDLAKISYANYRNCAGTYRLLDCGGALGRGCGPLLLSNGRPWDPESEVLVPGEHTTANFLLDFFHSATGGPSARPLRKRFIPFDALYRELKEAAPRQGVVIHEMRFTYAADGLTLLRDLGSHWEEATRHPIPLGAVAMRRGGFEDAAAKRVAEAIRASLAWSRAHPEEALALCRRHAQSLAEPVLRSHIDLYVNEFSHRLGPVGEEAVAFFLERQATFRGPPS